MNLVVSRQGRSGRMEVSECEGTPLVYGSTRTCYDQSKALLTLYTPRQPTHLTYRQPPSLLTTAQAHGPKRHQRTVHERKRTLHLRSVDKCHRLPHLGTCLCPRRQLPFWAQRP
ncbi:hypothetical protein OE88DRAFT_203161 [Heliocybe sulcata]|uniref:Uncharacterized protein n=1 Tax=Heliocybe sulcata TaxID=5364 RepID=A0A5C3MZT9_9AGAM|nr:hypothetical protein OE88DRAFT_203161 [Heliocybe sulcata]